jgi:hypothetical protein
MSAGETKGVMHVILHMSLMRVAERQFSNLKPINQEIGRMAHRTARHPLHACKRSGRVAARGGRAAGSDAGEYTP